MNIRNKASFVDLESIRLSKDLFFKRNYSCVKNDIKLFEFQTCLLILLVDYYVNLRFFNRFFRLKMKRLFLDNMKAIGMIQQFLITQTLQLSQLWF